MARKKKKAEPQVPSGEESFVDDYLYWSSPELPNKRQLDKTMGEVRGGNALTGLQFTIDKAEERLQSGNLNNETRLKLRRQVDTARRLQESGVVKDKPTTISSMSRQFADYFHAGLSKELTEGPGASGAGWYFQHHRMQREAAAPEAGLSARQRAAMGGHLSASKTPEDERVSLSGVSHLVSTQSGKKLGDRLVRDIPSAELGDMAASASSWNAYDEDVKAGRTAVPPSSVRPDFGDDHDLRVALVNAGRAHAQNVGTALDIARGNVSPKESFDVRTTPKTASYAEMTAMSEPDSNEETDYNNIVRHMVDVQAGRVSADQGMMLFSQDEGKPRPHALRSDVPAAMDTWMNAASSGQPAIYKETDKQGNPVGRGIRVSKRLTDKGMPLDATGYGKERLGLKNTGKSVTPEAAVSAQQNEALRRTSENIIGPVSFDQFGEAIYPPKSLVQEVAWTQIRREAGADPEYNAEQRAKASQQRTTQRAEKKAAASAEKESKALAKQQLRLPGL